MMSEFGKEMELDIVWNPLKVMSDKEQAEVNFIKSQTDTNLFNTGAVGDVDIREKLSKDKLSGYSGVKVVIDTPHDDIDKDDDKVGLAVDSIDDLWYVIDEEGNKKTKGYVKKGWANNQLHMLEAE